MIDHMAFRIFIFGLIIVNSLLIGLQTDEKLVSTGGTVYPMK